MSLSVGRCPAETAPPGGATHRVSGPEHHLKSRVTLDDQLQAALIGNLVHRAGRTPSHLLRADSLHQSVSIEPAQLRVQRPAGDPAHASALVSSAIRRIWWPCVGPRSTSTPKIISRLRFIAKRKLI